MDRPIDDFAARTVHGNLVAPETDLAHLDAHDFAAFRDRGFDHAAGRLDGELVLGDEFFVPEIARKNPQAVAAFFRLAAVGIVDPQAERRFFRRQRAEQNSVRTHAVIAVADGFDLFNRQWRG